MNSRHLSSVGKTADNINVSVFTTEDVKVFKEKYILITCKGKPILIAKQDERGRYRIPLVHNKGQWQPKRPTKASNKYLREANSVYDLPTTEEAIKWMHKGAGTPSSQRG